MFPTRPLVPMLLLAAACGRAPDSSSQVDSITAGFNTQIDFSAPTHVMAIGYSHGMGDQFVQAALARAYRYRELFPSHQVVFYASPETGVESDARAFTKYGVKVISDNASDHLSGPRLLQKMAQFSTIESLDFYGHSSAWGIGLEGGTTRLGTDTPSTEVAALRGKFTSTAYATLNGCSAGGKLAPFLSKHWRIPVSGALTGSNFQKLHNNGRWYVNDEGQFPAGGWASSNAISYQTGRSCSNGACLRLKPVNSGYRGYWGNLSAAGLGFYKFFCNYSGRENCTVGMAKALISYPTMGAVTVRSTADQFQASALEFLCPNDVSGTRREQCTSSIPQAARTNRVYSPFQGNTMKCTLNGCSYEDRCNTNAQGEPIPGTCGRSAEPNPNPTTYADEFLLYMDGFSKLSGQSNPYPAPVEPLAGNRDSSARCYVTATNAAVHRSPEGDAFEQLALGNRVTRTGISGEWSQVEFAKGGVSVGQDSSAFVRTSLLSCATAQPDLGRVNLPNSEKAACRVQSEDGYANVRLAPGGTVLMQVPTAQPIYTLEESGEWTRVEFAKDGELFGGQADQKTWIHRSLIACGG